MVLGACAFGVALAGAAWFWSLQPERKEVSLVSGHSSPAELEQHCKEAIGEPRIEVIGEGVFVAIGYDLANTIVVQTSEGNIVIDPAMSPLRAREVRDAMRAHAPGKTAAIIYTHSHIDHVGGAAAWVDEGTQIWATDLFVEHFVKQYSVFRPAETRRAQRQFGNHVALDSLPCIAIGRRLDIEAATKTGVRMPTHTFSGEKTLTIGGLEVELVEAHGETHDQLFVHFPSLGVLAPGDNYYRSFPNIYTIRGTSPRPVDAWIASLDAMRRRAPRSLVPSHTLPLRGESEIAVALTRYRDGIQWLRDRVIAAANEGHSEEQIAEAAALPTHLADEPALAPFYGQLDWSARAIYTNNLGWFDGRPEELYPLDRKARASKSLAMMGGADRVWAEVETQLESAPRWALVLLAHLGDSGEVSLEPGGRWALAKAKALEALAAGIGNSNGRGYLLESAHELRNGLLSVSKPEPNDELLDAVPISVFFDMMATRLMVETAIDTHESVVFNFTDTKERFVVTVRRGVAEIVAGESLPGTPQPVAEVTTSTGTWRRLATGMQKAPDAVTSGALSIAGDPQAFYTFTQRFRRGI